MLEDALKEEKESLEEMVAKLQPIVDEFTKIELRLQHINALLGIEPSGIANGKRSRINWAKLCRENGLPIRGDSGHRVLKRLKPQIHEVIQHECEL